MTEPITATIAHFMELSGLNEKQVRKLRRDGKIRSVKIGKRVMIILDSYRELCGLTYTPPHTSNGSERPQTAANRRRRILSNPGDRRSVSNT